MIGPARFFRFITLSIGNGIVSFFPYGFLSVMFHFFEDIFLFLNTDFRGDNERGFYSCAVYFIVVLHVSEFVSFSAAVDLVTFIMLPGTSLCFFFSPRYSEDVFSVSGVS